MPETAAPVLALDAGTTSVRAAVVFPDARLAGLNALPLATAHPAPGEAVQDPERVWRAARTVLRRALDRAGVRAKDLAGLGLATQRASVVVWARRGGRALTPLVLWSDLRGREAAAHWQSQGFGVSAQQAAPKLPDLARGTGRPLESLAWGALDSWLIHRLTGGAVHASDRSQLWPAGYLDLASLELHHRFIAAQGLDALAFPAVADSCGALGVVEPSVLGAPVPLTASMADQAAALTAHGETGGTAKITWGTAGSFDLATPGIEFSGLPALPPLIQSSAGGRTLWCIEGMILSAGAALDWLRAAFRLGSPATFDALAASAPTCGGLAFLPALTGLGAPHADPAARGKLVGLSLGAQRGQIARAGYEGLAFRAREIVARSGLPAGSPIGVDGGLTRSATFLQILADTLGRPLRPLASPEATLLGAALMARRGAGFSDEPAFRAGLSGVADIVPREPAAAADARFEAWKTAVYG